MTCHHSIRHLFDGGVRPEKTGNATSTVRLSTALGNKWTTLERLPPEIRQAIAQANVDLCPLNIAAAYDRVLSAARQLGLEAQAGALYLEAFDQAQRGEITLFSEDHRHRYGRDTPHVAAEATMITENNRPVRRRSARCR